MIGLLTRSYLRFVLRAPYSALSVFLGVLIGVASVTGVHVLGAQVNASLDALRPPHLNAASHVATRSDLTAGVYADLLEAFHRGELRHVASVRPLLEGELADGTRVLATDWLRGGLPAAEIGESPTGGGLDGVLVQGFEGVEAGGELLLAGRTLEVMGTVPTSELTTTTRAVYADLGLGSDLLGRTSEFDAVLLRVESPQDRLAEALELFMPGMSAGLALPAMELGPGWQVHDVQAEVAGFGLARAVLFNIGALGSLSLLVAVLLMYQTCVIWLRRQRDILSRLMEIGVPRVALAAGFVLALLVLGVLATGCGLFAGRWLAGTLLAQMGVVEGAELSLGAAVIVKSALAGVGVCVAGGVVAWHFEWRVADRKMAVRTLMLALLAVAGAAMLLVYGQGLVSIFAVILLVAGLVCWLSLPVLRWFRRLADRLRGSLMVRLALREATWFSGDLALAVASLALALGVSIGVGLMVDSFRREFVDMLDVRLQADLFVSADEDVEAHEDWLSSQPGTERLALYGSAATRVSGQPVSVGYTRFDAQESLRYGHTGALQAHEAIVSERTLRALDLNVGEALVAEGLEFRVVAAFPGFGDADLRMLVDNAAAEHLGWTLRFDRASISTAAPDTLKAAIEVRFPQWTVTDQRDMRATAIRVFDQTFLITDALTALAMIVASVALLNALAGLRLNQQATSDLLNVIGLNTWEMKTIDLSRSVAVGAVALLLALPLGLWLGWVLCQEVNPRAFGWQINLVVAGSAFVAPLAGGACAVLLAGLVGVPAEHRGRVT